MQRGFNSPAITQWWFQSFWLRRGSSGGPGAPGCPHGPSGNAPQLVLSDSCLSGGLEVLEERTPSLGHLSLSCDPIQDTEALRPLVRLQAVGSRWARSYGCPNLPYCPSQEKLKGLWNLELFNFKETQQLH